MALSPAEKQKAYRERKKQQQRSKQDSAYQYLKKPFFQHLKHDANWSDVQQCFDLMGIDPPEFEDDRGPEAFASDVCFRTDEEKLEAFASHPRSIGRADAMVGILIDAAVGLADMIRNYKLQELNARLDELEEMDVSDPETKKRVLKETVQIEKIKAELNRNSRKVIQQWEARRI